MRVVPVSAWLIDLEQLAVILGIQGGTDCEVVRERVTRENTTLSNRNRSVHVRGPVHVKSMEMKTCGLITKAVLDVDYQLISFVSHNGGDGPLAVDSHDRTVLLAIRIFTKRVASP